MLPHDIDGVYGIPLITVSLAAGGDNLMIIGIQVPIPLAILSDKKYEVHMRLL